MADPALPAGILGWPLLDGTGPETLHGPTADTEVEDGPARSRRASTATWSTVTHRHRLTHAQFASWQGFLRDTLEHGASRFTMGVWKPGATAPLPVRTVKILGDAYQSRGSYTFLTLKLSVRDY